jgi:hypothetical protein
VAGNKAMQTRDCVWKVEVYRQPRTRDYWYRLVNVPTGSVVEGLTIAGVERHLVAAGVNMADLVEVHGDDSPTSNRRHGAA